MQKVHTVPGMKSQQVANRAKIMIWNEVVVADFNKLSRCLKDSEGQILEISGTQVKSFATYSLLLRVT